MVPPPHDVDLPLSAEQERVLRLVAKGKSVFFMGPAGTSTNFLATKPSDVRQLLGTGKSLLLRRIIWHLGKIFGRETDLGITATTGVAALHIGGSTLHSFAGIGLGKEPVKVLAEKIMRTRKFSIRWRYLKALVIDEGGHIIYRWIDLLNGSSFDAGWRVV